MPKSWHDRHTVNKIEDEEMKNFYRSIVADKKPYFMRYIYPDLMRQYSQYIRNTNRNALREFQMTVDEMSRIPYADLTERQCDFLRYYRVRMPVGVGDCVMNRICKRFEEAFDGCVSKAADEPFDCSKMKSGIGYTPAQMSAMRKLYEDYNKRLQSYAIFSKYERVDEDEFASELSAMKDEFVRECDEVCQNKDVICDLLIDLCYRRSSSKKFVWDICGDTIIQNLLRNNGNTISAPVLDTDGDIEYCGKRYKVISKVVGEEEYECSFE